MQILLFCVIVFCFILIIIKQGFDIFFELFPFFGMIDIVFGAEFSCDIIVADQIRRRKPIGLAEINTKAQQGLIGFGSKFPGFVRMAAFDGNGIFISVIGCIGDFCQGDTLYNFSVQADNKMTAGISNMAVFQAFKIISVCFCVGAGIGSIMDNNIVDFFQFGLGTGIFIWGQKVFFNRKHLISLGSFRFFCPVAALVQKKQDSRQKQGYHAEEKNFYRKGNEGKVPPVSFF